MGGHAIGHFGLHHHRGALQGVVALKRIEHQRGGNGIWQVRNELVGLRGKLLPTLTEEERGLLHKSADSLREVIAGLEI